MTTNSGDLFGNGSSVSVFLGKGDGTFQQAVNYPTASAPYDVQIADVNGDGMLDIVVADHQGAITVFLSQGDGTFQASRTFSGGYAPNNLALGDFDGDGTVDAVVSSGYGSRLRRSPSQRSAGERQRNISATGFL